MLQTERLYFMKELSAAAMREAGQAHRERKIEREAEEEVDLPLLLFLCAVRSGVQDATRRKLLDDINIKGTTIEAANTAQRAMRCAA